MQSAKQSFFHFSSKWIATKFHIYITTENQFYVLYSMSFLNKTPKFGRLALIWSPFIKVMTERHKKNNGQLWPLLETIPWWHCKKNRKIWSWFSANGCKFQCNVYANFSNTNIIEKGVLQMRLIRVI